MASKKILIIRFSSLGDIALISPIISILHKRGFSIHLLTKTLPANLYFGDPRIDRIWRLEEYENLFKLASSIKEEAKYFDYIVDLHLQPRSVILTRLLHNLSRGGCFYYKKEAVARYILLYTHRKLLPIHHTIFRYLTAFPFLGSPETLWSEAINELTMPFFKEEIEELKEELEKAHKLPTNSTIFLAPGAKYDTKRWPTKYFHNLAKFLNTKGFHIGVVGGPEDKNLSKEILKNINGADYTGLTPRKTVLLLRYGKVLITNDSAHQHFAQLAGIQTITIFGPTVPQFGFYPLGKKDIIIQKKLNCRPCSMHGEKKCKKSDKFCLTNITPEEVYNTLITNME